MEVAWGSAVYSIPGRVYHWNLIKSCKEQTQRDEYRFHAKTTFSQLGVWAPNPLPSSSLLFYCSSPHDTQWPNDAGVSVVCLQVRGRCGNHVHTGSYLSAFRKSDYSVCFAWLLILTGHLIVQRSSQPVSGSFTLYKITHDTLCSISGLCSLTPCWQKVCDCRECSRS